MNVESAKRLFDARVACERIAFYVEGETAESYLANESLQLIVERLLITVGEAINVALQDTGDDEAVVIPSTKAIIGMRNRIVHGYDEVRLEIVGDAVANKVPELNLRFSEFLYGVEDWC